jgi:hypothetical protein
MELAFDASCYADKDEIVKISDACKSISYEPHWFSFPPFSLELNISSFSLQKPTYLLGSTKLLQCGRLPNNAILDYEAVSFQQHLISRMHSIRSLLLNGEAEYFRWADVKNTTFKTNVFIKPSAASKVFPGFVCPAGSVVMEELQRLHILDQVINDRMEILVDSVKSILSEYRAFVVNEEIIDITRSHLHGKLNPSRIDYTEIFQLLIGFITRSFNHYMPSKNFVIDVCIQDGAFKIVEYNPLCCSGMYLHKRALIYKALLNL